jgi:hypothetical protein
MDRRIAILKLVYEIDPDIPFLNRFPSSTVAEIIHSFGYEECTEDEWMSLTDGRFLSWMYSHEDHMACEALRIMTTGKQPSRSLGYKVLYNIDRDAAYDLREADTPFKVGEVLNEQLKTWQDLSDEEFDKQVADYTDPEGRFYYFAHLHGWIEQISQARACFDLKSEENRERLGAYDARTAAYRFCRILGVTPSYLLEDGNELKSGAGVDLAAYRPQMLTAIKQGSLSQWLSVFYHEDPTQDFTEEYSYERKLEEWVIKLGEIDKNHKYYKRFGKAKEETARKYGEVRKGYYKAKAKEKRWRIIYYGLCALFMLALVIFGIDDRDYLLRNSFTTIALPVGGMTAVIVGLRSYFRGYGFVMCCLWGVLGFLTSYIPITILKSVNSAYPSLFIPVIVVITLIYMLICHLTDYRTDSKGDNQLINEVMQDDIKSTLIEPLYYTFKQKSFRFKGSKFGILDDVTNQVRSISGESVLHYILWSIMVGLLLLEMLLFSTKLLNVGKPDPEKVDISPASVVEQIQKDVE